jgi:hypothetical protein
VGGAGGIALQDADGDTKIQVEESADEDKIRMDIGGTEMLVLENADPELTLTGTSSPVMLIKATVDNAGMGFKCADSTGDMWLYGATGRDHATYDGALYIYGYEASAVCMQIDKDGEVTKPLQPMYRGYAVITNLAADAAFKTFTSWTDENEVGTNFNSATGVWTCPVDGYYLCYGYVNFQNMDSACTRNIFQLRNSSSTDSRDPYLLDYVPNKMISSDTVNYGRGFSWIAYCDANDQLSYRAYQNATGSAQADPIVYGGFALIQ